MSCSSTGGRIQSCGCSGRHRDHDEIEGTLGEAPNVTQVVSNVQEVAALKVPDPNRVAYLTQTTLSLDEARDIIHALKEKFPNSQSMSHTLDGISGVKRNFTQ